jgi:hypothetical protein
VLDGCTIKDLNNGLSDRKVLGDNIALNPLLNYLFDALLAFNIFFYADTYLSVQLYARNCITAPRFTTTIAMERVISVALMDLILLQQAFQIRPLQFTQIQIMNLKVCICYT